MSELDAFAPASDELLPHTLFRLAKLFPDTTHSEYFGDPTNLANGYRKCTYQELANAVYATAWWIEKNIGKPRVNDGSVTMVYFGPNDLRYGILVLASVCVGYKMLFPSPRYGAEAIARLIDQVDGKIMLYSYPPSPIIAQVLQKRPMHKLQIPSLEDLLDADTQPYPFHKTFQQHKHEPLVALHTSGTTGFPKPILWTHDWARSFLQSCSLPDPSEHHRSAAHFTDKNVRVMFLFPPFHASGILKQLVLDTCTPTVFITPPSAPTPAASVDAMADALDFLWAMDSKMMDIICLPPPHAEYLASKPALLDHVSARVRKVVWSGGELSASTGPALAAKMQPLNEMGSTEIGLWPSLEKNVASDENWQYLPLHPALNIRLDPVAKDADGQEICEGVMVRNDESGWVQPLFKIFTEVKEKSLGDLFVRHPEHPELVRLVGRTDDMLNFGSEKFHPTAIEQEIAAHTSVEEVMMVGTKRPRSALIVRPKEGTMVDDVWAAVARVNDRLPVYARVEQGMLLIVKEPFLLTAKGSVQKKAMLELYTKELDDIYGRSTSTP
ncbi:hypothetical protein BKA63DRAFT_186920 [Paraphoma chrysanthemicola]|nr:hypothetical protein BKA63DRAFT_186920 [Paraphoma chrysanthemicola]